MTSIDGFFIGPLYYYLLIPFYFLSAMNPLSATFFALAVSVLTSISIFYVFSKIFNQKVGIIGSFIYASSLSIAFIDRWVVPTQPIVLWSVWFLFCLMKLINKDYKVLPIMGILVGLIWHIHIALWPLVILVPLAMLPITSKKPKLESIILFGIPFLLLTTPFWLFEIRHDFGQIKSLLNFYENSVSGEKTGLLRFREVIDGTSAAFSKIIFFRKDVPSLLALPIFYLTGLALLILKAIKIKQLILIILWTFLLIAVQQFSTRSISDYYFNSLIIIGILIISLSLSWLLQTRNLKFLAQVFMVVFLIGNLWTLFKIKPIEGYDQKKQIVSFIKSDSTDKNFRCLGINFIADFTKVAGYRYLWWYFDLNIVRASEQVPVYNVALPKSLVAKYDFTIGEFAVISPAQKNYDEEVCDNPNNKLPGLVGFTN
ncbi:MAG: glycosyltransferase family 39 protein [Patescibacteria group bacterium]